MTFCLLVLVELIFFASHNSKKKKSGLSNKECFTLFEAYIVIMSIEVTAYIQAQLPFRLKLISLD